MDKRMKKSLFILVLMGITYMSFLLYPLVSGLMTSLLGVLAPFIVGFAIAFILHPLVEWVVDRKVKRIFAVLIVVIIFIGVIVLFFGSFFPLIFAQFINVIKIAPEVITNFIVYIEDNVFEGMTFAQQGTLDTFDWQSVIATGFDTTGDLVTYVVSKTYSSVTFLLLTPILLIYFLFDYNNIRSYYKNFLNRHNYKKLYAFSKDYEKLLSRYVGGLLMVMIVLTIISTVMFSVSGLKNALLFGFIIGITNLIPFIGNIIGGAIAILFAMSQSVTLALIITVEVVILIIIESNFVTPMIQGKSVDISPLLIIFGITVFGFIFGFFGVLLAIPMIIFFKLLMKHYFEKL